MKFLLITLLLTSATAGILPSIPTGPLSTFQVAQAVYSFYNSPLAAVLPPVGDMIKAAMAVNEASNSGTEAVKAINEMMKKVGDNVMEQVKDSLKLPSVTTAKPSIFPSMPSLPAMPSLSNPLIGSLPSMPSVPSLPQMSLFSSPSVQPKKITNTFNIGNISPDVCYPSPCPTPTATFSAIKFPSLSLFG